MEGSGVIMIHYQLGHYGDISIHWELRNDFDNWVRGLRSIIQSPEVFHALKEEGERNSPQHFQEVATEGKQRQDV